MQITINLDLDDFTYGEGYFSEDDFKQGVLDYAKDELVATFLSGDNSVLYNDIKYEAEVFMKENSNLIVKRVVEEVANRIERKRDIVAITPKAKELQNVTKENETYFMELIEKCIAKKFK